MSVFGAFLVRIFPYSDWNWWNFPRKFTHKFINSDCFQKYRWPKISKTLPAFHRVLSSLFKSYYFLLVDYITAYTGTVRATSGANATAGIFTTFPPDNISNWTGFFDQVNFLMKNTYLDIDRWFDYLSAKQLQTEILNTLFLRQDLDKIHFENYEQNITKLINTW